MGNSRLPRSCGAVAGWLLGLLLMPAGSAFAQLPGSKSNTGYIDNAVVGTRLQLRYDFAHGNNRPDRAEFFYAKCGCYREVAKILNLGPPDADPFAPGPAPAAFDQGVTGANLLDIGLIEPELDYHVATLVGEFAFHERVSVFAEVPFRSIRPTVLSKEVGLSDVQIGVKGALLAKPDANGDIRESLTLQLRAYLPTGDGLRGLGTEHVSLEPALLYFVQANPRATLEGELRAWIPIDGSTGDGTNAGAPPLDGGLDSPIDEYSGEIIRYGVGFGYDLAPAGSAVSFAPVVEVVGWSVLGGIQTGSATGTLRNKWVADPAKTTIVNLKLGARLGFGTGQSIYVGYGEALTKEVWYERTIRVEYRLAL